MLWLYYIVLYGCTAAVVGLLVERWLGRRRRAPLSRARIANEMIWSAIPLLILLFLVWR